ncbi:unnamed protein product, partial [Hydatigera taeniaeformis]|uniref:Uncharacterized protein n=1 Tax=Hydatigena taeniaeformis TaxID=6205 RepID=A0A0R3XD83_HYDTA
MTRIVKVQVYAEVPIHLLFVSTTCLAGIRYNSVHSLNRTHPRDMTIGKAQSSDYLGSTIQPIRTETPRVSPIVSAELPPPSRAPAPKPLSRRSQRSHASPTNFDIEGSLFDAASSKGEDSVLGSGIRGADYEVPRQLSPNNYSSYIEEQEDPLIIGGGDFAVINDVGGEEENSVVWSTSNSYNPQPLQDSWKLQNTASSPPSVVAPPWYTSRSRGQKSQYANIGHKYPSNASSSPVRPDRRAALYARQ